MGLLSGTVVGRSGMGGGSQGTPAGNRADDERRTAVGDGGRPMASGGRRTADPFYGGRRTMDGGRERRRGDGDGKAVTMGMVMVWRQRDDRPGCKDGRLGGHCLV